MFDIVVLFWHYFANTAIFCKHLTWMANFGGYMNTKPDPRIPTQFKEAYQRGWALAKKTFPKTPPKKEQRYAAFS